MKKYRILIAVLVGATLTVGFDNISVNTASEQIQSEDINSNKKTQSEDVNSSKEVQSEHPNRNEKSQGEDAKSSQVEDEGKVYPAGEDLRVFDFKKKKIIADEGLTKELIATYSFNEATDFRSFEKLADEVMEEGKNPGLGISALHQKGYTGKGVSVAIIDQPIELGHPEYKGKIVDYKNFCDAESSPTSMHGPLVASLLAGNTIGVAPDVNIYYAAAPTWTEDATDQAKALRWLIKKNKSLPRDKKIKIVSVSASPSTFKNAAQWEKAVKEAEKAGMMVADRPGHVKYTGCFCEGVDRDDPQCYTGGYGSLSKMEMPKDYLLVPAACRTAAEALGKDKYSYEYSGDGGTSVCVPYFSGVMALGWQIKPKMSGEEMATYLFDTASINKEGNMVINPPAFIEALLNKKK